MRIITALIASLVSGPVLCQQNDPATDQELHASYCAGVLYQKLTQPNLFKKASQQARYDKFRAYLIARGVFNRVLASRGATLAAERGRADEIGCRKIYDSCIDRCLADAKCNVDDSLPTCSRWACETPNRCSKDQINLPF